MPSSKIVTTTPRPVMFLRHTGPTFMSNPRGPTVCPTEDKFNKFNVNLFLWF